MTKLSPAMQKMMERLRAGHQIYWSADGYVQWVSRPEDPWHDPHTGPHSRTVNRKTANALRDRGLLRVVDTNRYATIYAAKETD